MKKVIFTTKAPTPGYYSQGVLVNGTLYLAGQTGNVPWIKGEPVALGGIGPQTAQALENILAVVEEAGGTVNSIVDMRVQVKSSDAPELWRNRLENEDSKKAIEKAYKGFFEKHVLKASEFDPPARTFSWVSEIPLAEENTLVEMTAIAVIEEK
jgi:enamine deaminase RidA (YjgF/YER057c/UK114 family)